MPLIACVCLLLSASAAARAPARFAGSTSTQYVAIPVGVGALAWSTIPLRLTPEVRRPETGNGLYVFALPEQD